MRMTHSLNFLVPGRRHSVYFVVSTLHRAVFLVNSSQSLFSAAASGFRDLTLDPTAAILVPKLRNQFAEFLNEGYLEPLRLLASPTCVGFSTGTRSTRRRRFSREHGIDRLYAVSPWHGVSGIATLRIFLKDPPRACTGPLRPPPV